MTPKKPKLASVVQRVSAALICLVAFMVMASIFTPDRSRAGGVNDPLRGIPPKSVDYAAPSTNAHEGLRSMGMIEDRNLRMYIYATEVGPRYTIFELPGNDEVGTLLSAEQVNRFFPELQLPTLEMSGPSPLMMVEPGAGDWGGGGWR